MSFTYSGSPGENDLDTVRFLCGDTNGSEPFLSDEEIAFLIGQWEHKGTPYYAAAEAAQSISTRLTREIDLTSDGQTLALGQLRDRYADLATSLRAQHEDALVGGSSLYAGGMDAHESPDPSVKPLSFGVGMGDHPEAGNQDFGDLSALEYAQRMSRWGEQVP